MSGHETPGQLLIVKSLSRWTETTAAVGMTRQEQGEILDSFREVYRDLGSSPFSSSSSLSSRGKPTLAG